MDSIAPLACVQDLYYNCFKQINWNKVNTNVQKVSLSHQTFGTSQQQNHTCQCTLVLRQHPQHGSCQLQVKANCVKWYAIAHLFAIITKRPSGWTFSLIATAIWRTTSPLFGAGTFVNHVLLLHLHNACSVPLPIFPKPLWNGKLSHCSPVRYPKHINIMKTVHVIT